MTIFSFFTPFFIPALFSCLGCSHFQKKKRKKNATQKGQKEKYLCHVEKGDDKDQHPAAKESREKRGRRGPKATTLLLFLSTKEEGSRAFFDEDEDEEERGR